MSATFSLLLISTDESVGSHLQNILMDSGFSIVFQSAHTLDDLPQSKKEVDACILLWDLEAPEETLKYAQKFFAMSQRPVLLVCQTRREVPDMMLADPSVYGFLSRPLRAEEVRATIVLAIERRSIEHRLEASENDFRALVEQSPDVVIRFDRDVRFVYANPAFGQYTGVEEEDLIGQTHSILDVDGETTEHLAASVSRVVATGKPYADRFRLNTIHGMAEFDRRLVPEFDQHGNVASVLAISRDITRLRQYEQALSESQDMMRIILNNVTDHVSLINDDRTIIWANELSSIPGEALMGKPCCQAYFQNETACGKCIICLTIRDKRLREQEVTFSPSGTEQPFVYWMTSTIAARYQDDRPRLVLLVARDVTKRTRAMDSLESSRAEYRDLADSRAMLLDEVNHRVANNLSCIMGLLAMERERLSHSSLEQADLISDVEGRIRGLANVHNALSSRNWQAPPLDELAEEIIHSALSSLASKDRIVLVIDDRIGKPSIPPKHATALAMILNELTTNAVKYAFAQGQQPGTITLSLDWHDDPGGEIMLTFADTGPGWPENFGDTTHFSVGMRLIHDTIRSPLRGKISFTQAIPHGACATILFKPPSND